jgi:hypothetical protein
MLKNNVLLFSKKIQQLPVVINPIHKKSKEYQLLIKTCAGTIGKIFAAKLTSYNQIVLFQKKILLAQAQKKPEQHLLSAPAFCE